MDSLGQGVLCCDLPRVELQGTQTCYCLPFQVLRSALVTSKQFGYISVKVKLPFNNCSHVESLPQKIPLNRERSVCVLFWKASLYKPLSMSSSDHRLPISHTGKQRKLNHTLEQYFRYFLGMLTTSLVHFLGTHSFLPLTTLLTSTHWLATPRDSAKPLLPK